MNKDVETAHWSRISGFPKSQFVKPYVKTTSKYRINQKGVFGHGTCNVIVDNARITERVLMDIKVFSDSMRV